MWIEHKTKQNKAKQSKTSDRTVNIDLGKIKMKNPAHLCMRVCCTNFYYKKDTSAKINFEKA